MLKKQMAKIKNLELRSVSPYMLFQKKNQVFWEPRRILNSWEFGNAKGNVFAH